MPKKQRSGKSRLRSALRTFRGNQSPPRAKSKQNTRPALEALESRQMLSATPQMLIETGVRSDPSQFTQVDDVVFFTAYSSAAGKELWRTDGTPAGTVIVADIDPGASDSDSIQLTEFNGKLIFAANDGSTGLEPWISDGTLAGTSRIRDINPDDSSILYSSGGWYLPPISGAPFTEYQGELYFAADDGSLGAELWKTDGTESGTALVKDINPEGYSIPGGLVFQYYPFDIINGGFTESGGSLFFGAYTETEGFELWKTDGTDLGTTLVKDIHPGSGSSALFYDYTDIWGLTDVNGTLFFVANGGENGHELWKSDGSEAGTVQVKDINPGADVPSYPFVLTAVEDTLFFFAVDDAGEFEFDLWKSDGTEAGTVLVKEFVGVSYPFELVASDGTLFFTIDDGINGYELWKSDGTEAGTAMVADIAPEGASSNPFYLTPVSGGVAFVADDGISGDELWASDGTAEGTYLVADLRPGSIGSSPSELTYVDGKLYFSADDGINRRQPWVVDLVIAPVANAGGPYTVNQDATLLLSGEDSTGDTGVYEWDLDNDGQFDDATGVNPSFPTDTPGVFTIGLRINGVDGPTDTTIVTVLPEAASIGGPYFGGQGSQVALTAAASVGGLFEWDLDNDGQFDDAVGEDVFFNAVDVGVFTVALRVNGLDGPTDTTTVTVIPEAAEINGPYSADQGMVIVLSASGSVGGLFEWDFNDDGLFDDATGLNVDYDAVDDGVFPIALRVNGPGGPIDSTFVTVTPEIVNIGGPYFGERGTQIALSAAASVGGLFEWDLDNDGQFDDATGLTATFNAVTDGVFTIGIRVNGPGGSTDTTTVTVEDAIAVLGGPYSGDQGSLITLSAAASSGTLFEWDLDNDGQFDDATGVNVIFDSAIDGAFPISLRVNGATGPTDTTTVTVLPQAADIGGPYSGDEGTLVALDASTSVGGLFEWDLDNDGQYDDATGETAIFNGVVDGVYTIGLRVNGPGGPTDSTTVTVIPEAADIGGPYSGDEGTLIPLTAAASVGGFFEWDLDNDGQFDDATGETAVFNGDTDGVFTIGLRVNGPGGPTDLTTVTVSPAAAVIGGPYFADQRTAIALSAAGSVGGLFEWDLDNDGLFDDAVGEDVLFDAANGGVFTVVLRVNGPSGPTDSTTVTVAPEVAEINGPYSADQGTVIALSASGSIGGLFEWDFDDDGLFDDATGLNVSFDARDAGVFPVALRVNGPGGATDSTSVTVAPEIANIGGPYFAESGTLLALSAAGSVGGRFEWDLDNDGRFDDASGITAMFDAATEGVFTIGIRVNGPGGPTDSTTVTVKDVVAVIGGPYSGDEGTLIALDASASVGGLFEWDLDNDGEFDDATGETAVFNGNNDGVFTIGLRVNGPGGPTDSTTVTVIPEAANIGGPYSGGEAALIPLTAAASVGGLFEWDLDNDGQFDDATGETAVFSGDTVGVFNIGLRVNGPGGPTDSTTVTVIPEAADIGGPYFGVEAMFVPLTAAASVGALFEWDLDNDGQYDDATGENANFLSIERGVYTIGLRVNGPGGPTDSTTVTVTNAPPTAAISGTTDIYRGETVTFTLTAADPFPADQAGLFTFDIDWDGNGTIDETVADVPTGTTVQHRFAEATEHSIQVRATDQAGFTGNFTGKPITVSPFVVRSDGQGKDDLIWGGTPGLDAVYIVGTTPLLLVVTHFENSVPVNRVKFVPASITGKIILHGYEFADVLVGELATGNALEIHGGDGDDVIVGGRNGDVLFGDGGSDVILGGNGPIDGDDRLFGGEGKDTLFGHYGADTLDGGGGEDLLISDRFAFSDTPQDVQRIANEWKSARPYSERVSNIRGITSTGVNGPSVLIADVTVGDDRAEDTLLGGLGDLDWFFYDFDQDILGDTIEIGEEETDSDP